MRSEKYKEKLTALEGFMNESLDKADKLLLVEGSYDEARGLYDEVEKTKETYGYIKELYRKSLESEAEGVSVDNVNEVKESEKVSNEDSEIEDNNRGSVDKDEGKGVEGGARVVDGVGDTEVDKSEGQVEAFEENKDKEAQGLSNEGEEKNNEERSGEDMSKVFNNTAVEVVTGDVAQEVTRSSVSASDLIGGYILYASSRDKDKAMDVLREASITTEELNSGGFLNKVLDDSFTKESRLFDLKQFFPKTTLEGQVGTIYVRTGIGAKLVKLAEGEATPLLKGIVYTPYRFEAERHGGYYSIPIQALNSVNDAFIQDAKKDLADLSVETTNSAILEQVNKLVTKTTVTGELEVIGALNSIKTIKGRKKYIITDTLGHLKLLDTVKDNVGNPRWNYSYSENSNGTLAGYELVVLQTGELGEGNDGRIFYGYPEELLRFGDFAKDPFSNSWRGVEVQNPKTHSVELIINLVFALIPNTKERVAKSFRELVINKPISEPVVGSGK